ncbi:MAG: STAS domain-containing protein [Chloroflexota bacterium]
MKLHAHHVEDNNISVLELAGRFDAYEVASVKSWLDQTIPTETSRIIINLSDVNFIDSTGLATFVQGMKNCRNNDGDLILFGLQRSVRVIFELTRLDRAFDIFDSEEQAIQAFAEKAAAA